MADLKALCSYKRDILKAPVITFYEIPEAAAEVSKFYDA
jgi:hypothetical protein